MKGKSASITHCLIHYLKSFRLFSRATKEGTNGITGTHARTENQHTPVLWMCSLGCRRKVGGRASIITEHTVIFVCLSYMILWHLYKWSHALLSPCPNLCRPTSSICADCHRLQGKTVHALALQTKAISQKVLSDQRWRICKSKRIKHMNAILFLEWTRLCLRWISVVLGESDVLGVMFRSFFTPYSGPSKCSWKSCRLSAKSFHWKGALAQTDRSFFKAHCQEYK